MRQSRAALFVGGESTPGRSIVLSAGSAFRLGAQRLKAQFHDNGELMRLLLRHTLALITQMSQIALCDRHHSMDQQLCRWLLLLLDRLPDTRFATTQELIANVLDVRREGILDRAMPERLSCECYAVAKRETDRPLPSVQATGAG